MGQGWFRVEGEGWSNLRTGAVLILSQSCFNWSTESNLGGGEKQFLKGVWNWQAGAGE